MSGLAAGGTGSRLVLAQEETAMLDRTIDPRMPAAGA
jgi:hypothetical protein